MYFSRFSSIIFIIWGSEVDMGFSCPLGFKDDIANLDDAVFVEGIAQVLGGR